MANHFPKISLLILVLVLLLAGLLAAADATPRLVAVGDVHGDLPQLKAVLQLSGLTTANGTWIGKDAILVQMGDLLDRGPDDLPVLRFMQQLRTEAAAAGGLVVLLLGNHEIMNLESSFHYVHEQSMEESGGSHARKQLFSEEGWAGQFIRTFNITYVHQGTLFVHAGLLPSFASEGLRSVHQQAVDALKSNWWRAPIFSNSGPVWTRILVNEASAGRCQRVEQTLSTLGLQRMVVGHTPQRSGRPEAYCDDKLLAIDVGLSKWMYGHIAALEIATGANGELEISEIAGEYVREEDKPSSVGETETEAGKGPGLAEVVGKDAKLLQEMMETLQEAQKEQAQNEDL
jgi:hypothetical protein